MALLCQAPWAEAQEGPSIELWYGPEQSFGHLGHAQRWVNVLGTIENARSASFTVNEGEAEPLRLGPDQRRLLNPGDFNVEVDRGRFRSGMNQIRIEATDEAGKVGAETVTIDYRPDGRWPLPYEVDWKAVDQPAKAVQIVDGHWLLTDDGLRTNPDCVGYDRVVAIGDVTWDDYEIVLSFVVHAVDRSAHGKEISVNPGIGLHLRWLGHTDDPRAFDPPHVGWKPTGCDLRYVYHADGNDVLFLELQPEPVRTMLPGWQLEPGERHWLKLRVESTAEGSLYSMKAWKSSEGDEPDGWALKRFGGRLNLGCGSALFVAHHVDLTLGSVAVAAIDGEWIDRQYSRALRYKNHLPLFLVWLVIAVHGYRRRRQNRRLVLLLFLGLGLLFAEAVLGPVLDRKLPTRLYEQLGTAREAKRLMAWKDLGQYTVRALGWLAVAVALVRSTAAPRTPDGDPSRR